MTACAGATAYPLEVPALTDIEIAVLKRQVLSVFSEHLAGAWQDVSDLKFELITWRQPAILQVASDRDAVALVTMRFTLNETSDMIAFACPIAL